MQETHCGGSHHQATMHTGVLTVHWTESARNI